MSSSATADRAKHEATNVSGWLERLARAGYAAKGVLYGVIGLLAFLAAFTAGGEIGGSKNALSAIENQGIFGTILLWIIFVGLIGYALWQFFRAAMDPENEGTDAKAIAKRVFFAISGVIHAALAFWIFSHLLGSGGGGDSGSGGGGGGTQGLVGRVLEWGMIGRLLVGAAGLGIAGFGVQQLIKAYKVDLSDQLDLSSLQGSSRSAVVTISRVGLAARGVVFCVVGVFFLSAAWWAQSSESGGTGEALKWLGSFGPWVLGAIAIGLIAYGIYMLVKSRYRRIEPANA